MVHDTTVERVTNRVWGIFSSLDHGIAENNNRRALLRALCLSEFKLACTDDEVRREVA
jgi:hypothetical protein